jgi:anti-sigma regulatory factor (Ser/Thr protein kinase)
MHEARSASLDLAANARSAAAARHFVTDTLSGWGCEGLVETAALLTSELVTNAVLHARTPIRVVLTRLDDGVQVGVTDQSPRSPVRRRSAEDATTGRGLELLDRLASSWRVDVDRDGKTISFVVGETPRSSRLEAGGPGNGTER